MIKTVDTVESGYNENGYNENSVTTPSTSSATRLTLR